MRKEIINRKRNSKFAALVAAVMTMTLLVTGCGSTSNAGSSGSGSGGAQTESTGELTKVRYATMTGSNTQWYGIIGQEKGIWEKNGLDVSITEFASGIETINTLATDQADIGFVTDFAGLNRFGNAEGQADMKFFEEQCKTASYALYANPETVKSAEDLKGKKILVVKGTFLEYLDAVTVEQAGLTMDDVTEVPTEGGQAALGAASSGEADAMWTAGDAARRLGELGWKPIKTQSDIGVNTYVFHVAKDEYLKNNSDTVQKFIKAYEEINQFVKANMDEAADIIVKKTGIEKEMFTKTVQASEVIPEFTKESVEALEKIDAWAVENGFYGNNLNINDYIDTSALKAVFPDKAEV